MTSLAQLVDEYAAYAYKQVTESPDASAYKFVENLANWLAIRAQDEIKVWILSIDEQRSSSFSEKGKFEHSSWTLRIFGASKKGPLPGLKELQGYVDSVMHEAYHCEQRYLTAKALARKFIADDRDPQSQDLDLIVQTRKREVINGKVCGMIAALRDANVHAVQSAWNESRLSANDKQVIEAQVRNEEERVADWEPWFTNLAVIVWSSRVATLRGNSLQLRRITSDTQKISTIKDDGRYKEILRELDEAKGNLETKPDRSERKNIIAEVERRAKEIDDNDDLSTTLRGTIADYTPRIKQAQEKALAALGEFIEKSDVMNGDERAEKFEELGKEGSPVALLNDLAYEIYAVVDPTEASAWSLGQKAGDEFIKKYPTEPSQV